MNEYTKQTKNDVYNVWTERDRQSEIMIKLEKIGDKRRINSGFPNEMFVHKLCDVDVRSPKYQRNNFNFSFRM